jgi:hypothetical protein
LSIWGGRWNGNHSQEELNKSNLPTGQIGKYKAFRILLGFGDLGEHIA